MLPTGKIKPLALVLCVFLVSLPEIKSVHQWLPVRNVGQQQGYHSRWSARQLLYSVRMRVKASKGMQTAIAERAGLERSAWESRLPIFVIGLKHREKDRLAPFLLKLRWYEDLHVVEAVDGRTLEPTERMTSGEVLHLHPVVAILPEILAPEIATLSSMSCCLYYWSVCCALLRGWRRVEVAMCADWLF